MSARRGFTLLEVMVALAILATSLLAISDVVGGALRNQTRARNLEVATLLARGKMAQVEDHYQWKGFKTSDESDEGTFEEDGHPEVRWALEITAPPQNLDADQLVRSLTGAGLQELLGQMGGDQASGGQLAALGPVQAVIGAMLQSTAARFAEQVKRGLREVRLTVSWPENGRDESFQVKTHMLVLAPGELAPR